MDTFNEFIDTYNVNINFVEWYGIVLVHFQLIGINLLWVKL